MFKLNHNHLCVSSDYKDLQSPETHNTHEISERPERKKGGKIIKWSEGSKKIKKRSQLLAHE